MCIYTHRNIYIYHINICVIYTYIYIYTCIYIYIHTLRHIYENNVNIRGYMYI